MIEINDKQTYTVTNCHDCPFCNLDNEYGRDMCNISPNIKLKHWEELPNDKVHDMCPLKQTVIRVEYKYADSITV